MFKKFFAWYKRNYKANLYLVAFLFIWQLVHLYWLTVDVVFARLHGHGLWDIGSFGNILISLVDYTEIPAIILASLFYIHDLRKKFSWKSLTLLIFLNTQWLHLFWITDEIVVAQLTGTAAVGLPIWLSWTAIMIDYLELPVMYDTMKRVFASLRKAS
jgi:hypothetical protein